MVALSGIGWAGAEREFHLTGGGLEMQECIAPFAVRNPEDGSLRIDTRTSDREWQCVWRTAAGVLSAGKRYRVALSLRVLEAAEDSLLQVLVRQPDRPDLVRYDTKLPLEHLEFSVEVPADGTGYQLQLHARKQILAQIDRIEITEMENCEIEYPIPAAPVEPFAGELAGLPTGAPEFEIELPCPGGAAATVRAADFGVSPAAADNVAALNRTLAYCRETGAARLELSPGIYRFTSDDFIHLERLKDFTLAGNGATLVWHKKTGDLIHVDECERIRLADFQVDWDWETDPLASFVRVEAVNAAAGWVDLHFIDYDEFPRRDVRVADLEELDPGTMSVGVENGLNAGFEWTRGVSPAFGKRWLSGNLLRVNLAGQPGFLDRLRVGQLFRMRHAVYDMNGIVLWQNRHLTLENVTVHSAPGHAFLIGGKQQYWQFLRTHVRPPREGRRRPVTSTADHCHVANSRGYFKMIGCEFTLGGDDCLNVHDNSAFVTRHSEREVKLWRDGMLEEFQIGDPIELRHADYAPTGFRAPLAGTRRDETGAYLVFDRELPAQPTDGFVAFNWKYDTANILIRDCFFHDNRARGLLLLGRNITVENCRFVHNQMGAIKIETGYTFNLWSEGYGARNIVVRGNSFDTVNPSGTAYGGKERDIYIGVYLKQDPTLERTNYPIIRDILFENNRFSDSFGLVAYVSSAANVTFRGNSFRNPTSRRRNQPYRAAIFAAYADGVTVVNNRWEASPWVEPRLLCDPETTRNILLAGNAVVPAVPGENASITADEPSWQTELQ